MNTVAFLKACSKGLGIGPHQAMQHAERLYLSGYLSYPRTESSSYPGSFDFDSTLNAQRNDSRWGSFVRDLLKAGISKPKGGFDAGDHPPLTPTAQNAPPGTFSGDMARVYELVVRHFIATVSPDAIFLSTRVSFNIDRLEHDKSGFTLSGKQLISPGFLAVLLWKQYGDNKTNPEDNEEEKSLPEFHQGEQFPVLASSAGASGKRAVLGMKEGVTTPPGPLTESELITLMEKHGIGTDASIPAHIENILKRNYAVLGNGRRITPTKLGLVLAQGYLLIDKSLVLPQVRADIEKQCDLIAQGIADKSDVIAKAIKTFEDKFIAFVKDIAKMDVLFSSSFQVLAAVGKSFTRCGHTHRYLEYIAGPPPRLYNKHTETVLPLPVGGMIKMWGSGQQCPTCQFELCLYITGQPTRTFPLCPYCFTNFEADESLDKEEKKINSRRIVLDCPLPDLHPVIEKLTVCPDLDSGGVFILDVTSTNRWSFVSTKAPTTLYLPQSVNRVTILDKKDEFTGCPFIKVEFEDGDNEEYGVVGDCHTGCMLFDEVLQNMIRRSFGTERLKSSGRGRGRGGRGGRGDRDGGRGGRAKR